MPVPGHLPGDLGGGVDLLGERIRGLMVQARPLSGQQLRVDDLLECRVVETDAVVVPHLGDVTVDGHAEQVLDGLLVRTHGARQKRHRRDPPDHRRGPQQPAGLRRQVVDAHAEQLVERRWQRTGPVAGQHELFHEERIARRAVQGLLQPLR